VTTPVAISPASAAGLDITTPPTAAAAAMTLANPGSNPQGNVMLVVKTGGTTANLTISVTKTVPDGGGGNLAVANRVEALAANKQYLFGPFAPGTYNDVNQNVGLAFDAITAIEVMGVALNN
jgi:hypothetical protein